ncbi:hypothetical protein Anas_00170 [Armadillidium nasatum]|uniref:Uncharacterized protein n=1 Tax=Armadillidium nasatum TaxID=96803 RepID=A0A5N5TJA8_9CRUS|nr:hypothetical protein Anas_00170 [Armadillidium nasatum]
MTLMIIIKRSSLETSWSSRSLWEENLNAAQVRTSKELEESLTPCVASSPPTDSPSPIVHHDSAFDDLKFDDPLFKENLVPPSPYKHESYSSAGSLIETFVEPLEDTGIILNASPFIEQQYETLVDKRINSPDESDNGENLFDMHPSKSNVIVDYINAKDSLSSMPVESSYDVEMVESQIPESLTITESSEDFFMKNDDLENFKSNLKAFPEQNKYTLETHLQDPFTAVKDTTEDILISPNLEYNSVEEEHDDEYEKSIFDTKFSSSSDYTEQFYDGDDYDYYHKKFSDVITPFASKSDINMKIVHPNPSHHNRAQIVDRNIREFPEGEIPSINPNVKESDFSSENLDMTEEESQNIYAFLKSCINICKDKLNEFYNEVVDKPRKKKNSENIFESFSHILNNYIKLENDDEENEEPVKKFFSFLKNKFYKDGRTVLWNDFNIFKDDSGENEPLLGKSSVNCQMNCDEEEKFDILSYWIKNMCNHESAKLEDYFIHSRISELCHFLNSYFQKSPCDCNGINTELQVEFTNQCFYSFLYILEKLKLENEDLQERILELQAENTEPFKNI